jgi:MraZ protein
MFRGRFEHTIDAKGRVSIPAKFRELLTEKYDERLIVTNFDRCLLAFPFEEWTAFEKERASQLSMVKNEAKAFLRFFISGATECPIDKLGRILIPPTLRDYAHLGKDVVFVGLLNRFEIWSRESWMEEFQHSKESFEQMSDTLAGLGI